MNWDKLEQLERCTIRKVGAGIAQVFKDLSNPLRFTLNQWPSSSAPTEVNDAWLTCMTLQNIDELIANQRA